MLPCTFTLFNSLFTNHSPHFYSPTFFKHTLIDIQSLCQQANIEKIFLFTHCYNKLSMIRKLWYIVHYSL
jgi:hypothetical protein